VFHHNTLYQGGCTVGTMPDMIGFEDRRSPAANLWFVKRENAGEIKPSFKHEVGHQGRSPASPM